MPPKPTTFKDFFRKEDNLFITVIFIVTIFIVCLPLISRQLPIGADWEFHLLRIESMKEDILSGQFPVKVNSIFFNGFGYGSSLFYPNLFLYIPAVFRLLGFNLEVSYKLFIILVSLACFFSAYISGKGITKSKYAAVAIAIIFCMSQYRLENIYTRFALGEVQAFIFLPLIAYGLYDFLYEKFEKPWLLITGFSGLAYSHIISLFICVLASAVVSLLCIKHLIKNSYKIKRLFLSALLVLGLTAAFWIPFVEQLMTNPLKLQTNGMMSEHAVSIPNMFARSYTIKSGENVSIGISLILLCFFRILLIGHERTEKIKIIDYFLLSGFVLMFLASELFPWDLLPQIFDNIQFPWRFYGLATISLVIAIGMMFTELIQGRNNALGLVLLLIVMSYSAISVITESAHYIDISKSRYQYYANSYPGNGYEYLPRDIYTFSSIYDISNVARKVVGNNGDELSYQQTGVRIEVDYLSPYEYIDVPLLYYKGYTAVFEGKGGDRISLNVRNNDHVLRVSTSGITEGGIIHIAYTGTALQRMSYIISLITVFIFLFFLKRLRINATRTGIKSFVCKQENTNDSIMLNEKK